MSRPLRIAVVTETYPPEVNGVARTMGQIVETLRARGHSIELTRPARHAGRRDDASTGERFSEHFVRGLPIPRYSELQIGFAMPGVLARCWKAARPDVVHVVTEGPLGWPRVIDDLERVLAGVVANPRRGAAGVGTGSALPNRETA